MKKILFTALLGFYAFFSFGQNSFQSANFNADCTTDFWTITATGFIQQWSLSGSTISGGDTILSGGGQSISYCGDINSPTFYTDNWNSGQIGIKYYEPGTGWINIPTLYHVQDNGGHLNDQYYTVVGGVIQYVTYWDGTDLIVIDSMPGEFFAGIFDIGVDTLGHAWIFTASSPGTSVDSLKVYDQNGRIDAYSIQFNMQGYGSFFLNDTLYVGTLQDSIFPVLINGSSAQLGIGISFPSNSFTDMASCQRSESTASIAVQQDQEFKIFPNPTDGKITIEYNNDISNMKLIVLDAIGKQVIVKTVQTGDDIELKEFDNGIYYFQFINPDDKSMVLKKLVKQ